MRLLQSHFLKEFIQTFFSTLFTLIFIFLAGRGFIQMADLIFNKELNVILVAKLFFLTLPFILIFIIPISVLIATLLTFGRLSHDNEIMAARASGISLFELSQPLILSVFALSLFSFILSDRIASSTHYAYRVLLAKIGIENPAAVLEEGTFIKRFRNFVIFIYEIDKNHLKGIRIYQPQEGRPTRTIVAQKGELISIPEKNIVKLRLIHGTSDEPDPKDPSKLYKLNFKTYDLPLNLSSVKDADEPSKKPKDMNVKELKDEIRRLGRDGIKATYALNAEIYLKMALALSSLGFLLIGIPLGITARRNEKSVNFAISLIVMIGYWILLMGGKALAQKGALPAILALNFCNIVALGLGLFLFIKMAKN